MEPRWWSHFTSSNTLNCTSSPTRPGEVANQPASPDGHKLKPQRHWQHCIWKDLWLQPVEFTILRFMWCILGSAAYTSVDFWSAMWFINEGFNYTQISFLTFVLVEWIFTALFGFLWIYFCLFPSWRVSGCVQRYSLHAQFLRFLVLGTRQHCQTDFALTMPDERGEKCKQGFDEVAVSHKTTTKKPIDSSVTS